LSKQQITHQLQRGFTLVELLIVVIILAILAAIVVPQFASSTTDAEVSSLDTTLTNMRSAVDLYFQQHGEYPGALTAVVATCPNSGTPGTGVAPTGTVGVAQTFLDQMSMYTDTDGKACSTTDTTFKFGPYLKKKDLPSNPVSKTNALSVVAIGDLVMAGASPAAGWKFDVITGKFIANDSVNTDSAGNTYDTH